MLNKILLERNSLSPSFKFGNKKIIVGEIKFKTEGQSNKDDLYRYIRELNKKFKQI